MTYSILQTYQHDVFSRSELPQTDDNITFLMRVCRSHTLYCVYQTNRSSGILSLVHFRRIRKIQKATIGFVPVRLSVRMDGFIRNLVFEYFSKICCDNSSFIQSVTQNGYFTWRQIHIFNLSRWILFRMRKFQSCRGPQNTHFNVQ